ncbi:MAG: TlpA family protein disulfide reductase [Bacteroidia bacterium]|nr:TlpA family protein disulfide reductase [Bacteroidia bacterium]
MSQENMSKYGKHPAIWENTFIEVAGTLNPGSYFNISELISGKDQHSTLVSTDGILIDHAFLKGKIVIIDFWYIRCQPCMRELPGLHEIAKLYPDNDVVILSLSRDDEESIQEYGLDTTDNVHMIPNIHPLVIDGADFRYPFKALVGPEGQLIYSLLGAKKTNTPIATLVSDFSPKIDFLRQRYFMP